MQYRYTAVNLNNKKSRGTISASDLGSAISLLQQKGLTAVKLNNQNLSPAVPTSVWEKDIGTVDIHKKKMKKKKLLALLSQMSIMIKAGVTLSVAMNVLIESEKDKTIHAILQEMNDELYTGAPLSIAMAKFKAFPEIIVSIIESGEANGRLDVAFERCAQIIEKEITLTSKVKGALGYPIFLFFLTIGLMVVMNAVVLPKFSDIFKSFGAELPAITVGIMNISDFITHKWYAILLFIFLLIFSFLLSKKKSKSFAMKVDRFILRIPLIGELIRQSHISRFCRIMASLVEAGVDIVHALEIANNVIGNRYIKNHLSEIITDVKVGIPIHQSMSKFKEFDSLLVSMIRVGEESGLLYETMDKMASMYEQQTDATAKQLTSIMEPAMTIIIALIVGTVIISIVIPMMGMYSIISGG